MIDLTKPGDILDLSEVAPNSSVFNIGLNWEGRTDVDVTLFALDAADTLIPGGELSFQRMNAFGYSMFLDKDDRGGGAARAQIAGVPRENARVILSGLPANVAKVAFGAWVWTSGVTFGMVPNCVVQIMDISNSPTNIYPGTDDYKEKVLSKGIPVGNSKLSSHVKDRAVYAGAFVRQADGKWNYTVEDVSLFGGKEAMEKFFQNGSKKTSLFAGLRQKFGV